MLSTTSTSPSDSFPSSPLFETSDSILEEFGDELAHLGPFPPGNEDDNFDPKADLREIEYLLNRYPSTDSSPTTDFDIIEPILEMFTDEPALVYSSPPRDDDDDLFDFKSDNEEWKKILAREELLMSWMMSIIFEITDYRQNVSPPPKKFGKDCLYSDDSSENSLSDDDELSVMMISSFMG
nr:hypothetical protein [Tanacetum cinerariifolium]